MGGTGREFKDEKYDEILQAETISVDSFKVVCLLEGADSKRYYGLC